MHFLAESHVLARQQSDKEPSVSGRIAKRVRVAGQEGLMGVK